MLFSKEPFFVLIDTQGEKGLSERASYTRTLSPAKIIEESLKWGGQYITKVSLCHKLRTYALDRDVI